jgi:very-short-patch-repair endonuclease
LFKKIEERASFLVENGKPQEIANTAWAFATLNVPAPALFKKIDARASFLVENGIPRNIAITAWAFAALKTPAPALFKEIEERASVLVEDGTTQAFTNTAWACARLLCDAPALFAVIDAHSQRLLETPHNEQCIANTALAFAELGIPPRALFGGLEKSIDRFLASATNQGITNVCWSLVVLDMARKHEALLQPLWDRAMRTDATAFSSEELVQLVQVELHTRASGIELSPPVPPALRLRMIEAAGKQTPNSSRFEDEYSTLLKDIGFEHEREVSPFAENEMVGNVLAMDMACSTRKIAVECDGPFHYLSSGRESGRTLAKRRMLERLGWKVVNIPYEDSRLMESRSFLEKNSARGGERELKMQYLRKRLENEAGIKF